MLTGMTCNAGQGHGSKFLEVLRLGDSGGDYSQVVSLLRRMSPNAIDQELRAIEVRLSRLQILHFISRNASKLTFAASLVNSDTHHG